MSFVEQVSFVDVPSLTSDEYGIALRLVLAGRTNEPYGWYPMAEAATKAKPLQFCDQVVGRNTVVD